MDIEMRNPNNRCAVSALPLAARLRMVKMYTGRWVVIGHYRSGRSASSCVWRLRRIAATAGWFEFTVRSGKEGAEVFAIYLGPTAALSEDSHVGAATT